MDAVRLWDDGGVAAVLGGVGTVLGRVGAVLRWSCNSTAAVVEE